MFFAKFLISSPDNFCLAFSVVPWFCNSCETAHVFRRTFEWKTSTLWCREFFFLQNSSKWRMSAHSVISLLVILNMYPLPVCSVLVDAWLHLKLCEVSKLQSTILRCPKHGCVRHCSKCTVAPQSTLYLFSLMCAPPVAKTYEWWTEAFQVGSVVTEDV